MTTISTSISLQRHAGPTYDQGAQGACVAFAYAAALTLQLDECNVNLGALSQQFIYNDTRIMTGSFPSDVGSVIQYAQTSTITHGVALASMFAYGDPSATPSPTVYADAATRKVLSFSALNIYQSYTGLVASISEKLMQGKPVLVTAAGTKLSDGEYITQNHEYLIVGKDDASQTLTFQNSWGPYWSGDGYGQIKYSEFTASVPGFILYGLDVINGFAGHDWTWTANRIEIAKFYAGFLGRCGEHDGIIGWAQGLDGGVTMTQAANAFYGSAEAQAKYGAMSSVQYVNAIYTAATARIADSGAVTYFSGLLDSGTQRGDLAYSIFHWIDIGNDTQAANDRLDNLATVSMNYGITMGIDGSHAALAASCLANVTDNADTVQAAIVGIETALGW